MCRDPEIPILAKKEKVGQNNGVSERVPHITQTRKRKERTQNMKYILKSLFFYDSSQTSSKRVPSSWDGGFGFLVFFFVAVGI